MIRHPNDSYSSAAGSQPGTSCRQSRSVKESSWCCRSFRVIPDPDEVGTASATGCGREDRHHERHRKRILLRDLDVSLAAE